MIDLKESRDITENDKEEIYRNLNFLKEYTELIIRTFNVLEEEINSFFNDFHKSFPFLLKEIEEQINLFEKFNDFNHENFNTLVVDKFNKCTIFKSIFLENENLTKINTSYDKMKNIINYISEKKYITDNSIIINDNINSLNSLGKNTEDSDNTFDPFNNDLNNNSENSGIYDLDNNLDDNYYSDNKDDIKNDSENDNKDDNKNDNNKNKEQKTIKIKTKEDNITITIMCSECKTNEATKICTHCNKNYCKGCSDFISEYQKEQNHEFKEISRKVFDIETVKNKFLKNFIEVIKYYLLKCNDLLNSDKLESLSIEKVDDFEEQKIYLNKINELCPKITDDAEINGKLISSLENIFKNKKLHISNDINDFDDDFFSDEKFVGTEDDFENMKNELFYFITVLTKDNCDVNLDIADVIINKISNLLSIKKSNIFILINDTVNNFVKSNKLFELSDEQIKIENPIFNKLNEIKLLTDNLLINECKIPKKYFDCRGNRINYNTSNNIIRGTEKYIPPYGWIGIGLNVVEKYANYDWIYNNTESSEWAIAYHGISPKISSNIIKKLLNYIITKNGIKRLTSKMLSKSNDKRHWGKVGEGIYLSPNIKTAEKYTGIVEFDNKKYKVLFMSRVFIKGIREPEKSNFWVLYEKYIRIYRLLLKRID